MKNDWGKKKSDRPYIIAYVRGARKLYDSARSLDEAQARIAIRLAKRHNRGEVAHLYKAGRLIGVLPPTA